MEYRPLGHSGLQVSALAMGTVSLGVDYGIRMPGQFGCPNEADAIALLRSAAEQGINLFDTAPNYGNAERVLGLALGSEKHCLFATKVNIPRAADGMRLQGEALRYALMNSVDASLKQLCREQIDILQIHNANLDVLHDDEFMRALEVCRASGRINLLGASVYTESEALAAVNSPLHDVLQAAFNLLDQRLREHLLPAARAQGCAFIARSAYLKGVLTPKAQWLPASMQGLRDAAAQICARFAIDWEDLPSYALRFCLSEPDVASVLIGPRTLHELDIALTAAAGGPLPAELWAQSAAVALSDPQLLNPSSWPLS